MNINSTVVKYGIVGLFGMCVDFGITFLCKEFFFINKYISNAVGFITAVVCNYFFNRRWTFESTKTNSFEQFFLFSCFALIGLLLNTGIIKLCTQKVKLNFYMSKIIAVGIVFMWNYLLNKSFTFQKDEL